MGDDPNKPPKIVHPPRSDTIGETSKPYGPARVEVRDAAGQIVASVPETERNHCWVPGLAPDTEYRAGNLQLTFFMNGNDCVADIDIDDANGFAHVFQVLRNKLSGEPTHPYNIHEILIASQGLDPGYTFRLFDS